MKIPNQKKFPTVFLACPFNKDKTTLEKIIDEFPWIYKTAEKTIQSETLLQKILTSIKETDYSIFDISHWNANVCLELGLAVALKKPYYIINNKKYKSDAPSDIKGIERVDYYFSENKKSQSLFEQIKNKIFKNNYYTAKVWSRLEDSINSDKKFTLALRIFAQFRGVRKEIRIDEIKKLARGLNLKRADDFTELIQCLTSLNLFKKVQGNGALKAVKRFY